jgi:hypothetical protein
MLGWELGCRLGCNIGGTIVGIIVSTEYKNNLNKECSLLSEISLLSKIESNRLLQAIEENKERSE